MGRFQRGFVSILLLVGLASIVGCSSGGDSAPATTATAPLTDVELSAFNDFVDNGTLLNQNGRRCVAVPFLREFGTQKLQAFGAGVPLADGEANETYEFYKKCFAPVSIFNDLYPPSRTTDQLRCLQKNGPPESEAKRLLVGLFKGTKMQLNDEIRAKAEAAAAKCMNDN